MGVDTRHSAGPGRWAITSTSSTSAAGEGGASWAGAVCGTASEAARATTADTSFSGNGLTAGALPRDHRVAHVPAFARAIQYTAAATARLNAIRGRLGLQSARLKSPLWS